MAEIYRGTSQKVYLDVYGGTTTAITAQLYVGDSAPVSLTPVSETITGTEDEKWSVYIGLQYTGNDNSLRIVWTFTISGESASVEHDYDVVTPFVLPDEIRDNINVPSTVTDTQLRRVERRIRQIINIITGQKFGRYTGDLKVIGLGGRKVRLPDRLISFTAVAGTYVLPLESYVTRADGWWLEVAPIDWTGDLTFNDVIYAPGGCTFGSFREDHEYTITGTWGYNDVPSDIKEAALLLIEDELCPTSEFRNKYIKSVAYADTDFTFDPRAFQGTGNARVDRLLSSYPRMNYTVI
jgi:hypothetical protein